MAGAGTLEQGLGLQRTHLETAEVQRQKKSPGLPAGEPRRHSEPESAPAVPSRGDRSENRLIGTTSKPLRIKREKGGKNEDYKRTMRKVIC